MQLLLLSGLDRTLLGEALDDGDGLVELCLVGHFLQVLVSHTRAMTINENELVKIY